MVVIREELNPCTVKLKITCDPEQVKTSFDKAFKQIAKKIKLPGFRPGHAPRAILENLVPSEDLYNQAADFAFRTSYPAALAQNSIHPDTTTRPQVEVTKIERESSIVEFSVKVALPPQIELGEYRGLPIEKTEAEVSEEEIDAQIEEFRKGRSTQQAVTDRAAQEGDVAVVNIKIEGDSGDGRIFMVVVGQTKFPDLDAALLDMRVEEMKSLDLAFPEGFQDKEWAGTKKHAQVTLNSLSAVQLPALDDEFAKTLQTDNIASLRARLRELIGKAKSEMSRSATVEKLLDALHERSKIYVSDNMWEELADRRIRDQIEEQHKLGKTLEQYAAENGMTAEELVEAWKSKAKMHVERALMIREVFSKEGMKLTNTELNQELFAMAGEYQIQPDEMLKALQENQALEELQYRSISRKVSDFLVENASIDEPGSKVKKSSRGTTPVAEAESDDSATHEKPKSAPPKRVRASSLKAKTPPV